MMKLVTMVLCTSLATLPLVSHAGDLQIGNESNYNLSFQINSNCSDKFGVVPTGTIKVISEKDFNKECEYNPKNCVTNVYSSPHCKGSKIAEVGFDTSYGVSYLSGPTSGTVSVTGSGFNLFFTSPINK